MALIKCIECGKEVSDKADACISCGNPMRQQAVVVQEKVQIEQTDKEWKVLSIFAILFVFGGFFTMFSSIGWGFFLIFIAFVLMFISGIGSWWTNG